MKKITRYISVAILIIGISFLLIAGYNYLSGNYTYRYDEKLIIYFRLGLFLTFIGFFLHKSTDLHIKRNWVIFILSAFIPILIGYLYFHFWELDTRRYAFEHSYSYQEYLKFEAYMYFLVFFYFTFNLISSQFTTRKLSFMGKVLSVFIPFYLFYLEYIGYQLNTEEQIETSLKNEESNLAESKTQLEKLLKKGIISKEEYTDKFSKITTVYSELKQQKTDLVFRDLLLKNEEFKALKSLLDKKIISDAEFGQKVEIIKEKLKSNYE